MPTNPITPDDAVSMRDTTAKFLRYASGVVSYLQDHGYCPADHLLREAIAARDAAQGLFMAAHYESCSGGVGREARK